MVAADSWLLVEPGDSTQVEVKAPALLTRAFLVTNTSQKSREVVEEVLLPEGWQLIARDSLFSLQPTQCDLRLLGISVPARIPPGSYRLTYVVKDRTATEIRGQCETEVVILPVAELNITPSMVPARILAGEDYSALFRIEHHGNTPTLLALNTRNSSGFPVFLSDSIILVQPSEIVQVTAIVKTDPNTRRLSTDRLLLTATASDSMGSQSVATAAVAVEIIPRAAPMENQYHRIPSKIATRFVHDEDRSGLQSEFSGTGTLDAKGDYRIDYLVRGPHDLERNTFGLRDEYFLRVQGRMGEMCGGDLLFSLSPLTEQHRFGRGVKATVAQGPFQIGGYSFRARQKYPDLEETAAFASFKAGPVLGARLNYLNKRTLTSHRSMASISSTITPSRNVNMELEYALGEREGEIAKLASGLLGRATVRYRGARLSLNKIYAHPDFPGYYRDQDYTMTELRLPLSKDLLYHASYRLLLQNLERDTTQSTAIRENDFTTGLTYAFKKATTATVEGENLRRVDRLTFDSMNQGVRALTLRLRQDIHALTLTGSVKRGIGDDHATNTRSDLECYNLGASLTPAQWQNYSASFQTGHSGISIGAKRSRTVALSASYRLFRQLWLSASFQKSDWGNRSDYENDLLSVDARCSLFHNHVLSFRFRRSDYKRAIMGERTSYVMSYEIPIGMPTGKLRETGNVKGRVYDAEDLALKGLSGVLLSLGGMTTLTDRNGNYAFSSIQPGMQYLQVDHASIGLDRVILQKSPVQVSVSGGRSEKLDLGVIRSSAIYGEVAVFGLAENGSREGIFVESDDSTATNENPADELSRLYGLSNLHLELRSEKEVLSATTDSRGRFSFEELRPGQWELRISQEDLPPYHDAEPSAAHLTVGPGSKQEITIRIVPRTRRILIVDEGRVPVVTRRPK
jgi:hypothetical protein